MRVVILDENYPTYIEVSSNQLQTNGLMYNVYTNTQGIEVIVKTEFLNRTIIFYSII